MPTHHVRTLALVLVYASLGLFACDVSTLVGSVRGGSSKPVITIQSPANGSQFQDGEEVAIQSQARDAVGIVRVELSADGAAVNTAQPPVSQGQVSFTVVQKWKAAPGTHTLSVRAFNTAGVASDPALVTINVGAAVSSGGATVIATRQVAVATVLPPTTAPSAVPTVGLSAATATRIPPTRVPPTPSINAPPGVYATSVRVDPKQAGRAQNVSIYVTFLNTTGVPKDYRLRNRIYWDQQKNSFGDTPIIPMTIPVGSTELLTGSWAKQGPGDCMNLQARVFWVDPDSKQETEFIKPDASGGPAGGFQVCP